MRSSQRSCSCPYWYAQAALAFLLLGIETKGRSIEEIGRMLDGGSDYNARGQVAGTSAPGLLR